MLYVGRLEVVKGVDYLIKAFAYVHRVLPETRLRIVGDGSQREVLKIVTKQLGLSDVVEFAGWVKQSRSTRNTLRPLSWQYLPYGRKISASVATRSSGYRSANRGDQMRRATELIDTDVTGVLVEPADEYGLAHAMSDMTSDRHKLTPQLPRLRSRRSDFAISTFMENLLDVYQKVLDDVGEDKKSGARRLEYQERH